MASQPLPSTPDPIDSLDASNNECAICQEPFEVNPEDSVAGTSTNVKRARVIPEVDVAVCGHIFHKFCIHRWLKAGGKECPLCRKKTTKRGLRKIFNFPLSQQDENLRKYEEKVVEVDELQVKLDEEKRKVEGMEEMMKQMLEDMEGVQGELNRKVEDLREKMEGMKEVQMELEVKLAKKQTEVEELREGMVVIKGVHKDLEGILEGKGKEFEKLKERMEGVQKELDRTLADKWWEVDELRGDLDHIQNERELDRYVNAKKLNEMAMKHEAAQDKMREDFEEDKKREVMAREEYLRKMMGEKEKELEVEKRKNEYAEKLFVERMKKRVSEEQARMKREKEVEGKIRNWEEMYKLCKMEKDKEMGKAVYFENWCKRLVGIEESSERDIADLTEVMQRKLNGGEATLNTDGERLPVLSYYPQQQQQPASKFNCEKESVDLSESDDDQNEGDAGKDGSTWKGFCLEAYLGTLGEGNGSDDNTSSDDDNLFIDCVE